MDALKIIKTIVLVSLIVFIGGCKTKYITQYEYITKVDTFKLETKVTDTIYKPLKQFNSVIAFKKSFLQTDYSMSWASIDSSGLLHHSIQNKDVIPAKKYEINKFVGKKYYIEKRIPYKVEVIKYKYDKWFFILLGYAVLTIIYKIWNILR